MFSRVIAIIPAWSGPKDGLRDDLLNFCGHPLLAWTILQARQSKTVDEVYVSSDNARILAVAVKYGAVPVRQPTKRVSSAASSRPERMRVLDMLARDGQQDPDIVVFLSSVSPVREPKDIDRAVRALRSSRADVLISVSVLKNLAVWRKKKGSFEGINFDSWSRGGQSCVPVYVENGSICVFKRRVMKRFQSRRARRLAIYEMPRWKSFRMDSTREADICKYYFRKKILLRLRLTGDSRLSPYALDLIVYDFDGVMTDNRVRVREDGHESVRVNRADGMGVEMIRRMGIPQLILSTETNPVVRARARKLKLEVIDSCPDKAATLAAYCKAKRFRMDRVAFVGNDINDLDALRAVGVPMAPVDAHPLVLAVACIVTRAKGGEGVVREIADLMSSGRADAASGISKCRRHTARKGCGAT